MYGASTQTGGRTAQQALSLEAYAWRDRGTGICISTLRGNRSRHLSQGCALVHSSERQRRVQTKGEEIVTRQSYQKGYVSDPIRTQRGIVFKIRYRMRTAEGKWIHKTETLYGLAGKKVAREQLDRRIKDAENQQPELTDLTLNQFIEGYWRPYLDRKEVKP